MNKSTDNRSKNTLWSFPWGYRESFIIAVGLAVTGLFMQSVIGTETFIHLGWPYNLITGLAYTGLLLIIHSAFRNHPLVQWLSSIPASISAISVFSFMAILLGLFPQKGGNTIVILRNLNLSKLNQSYPFLLSQIYFVTILGFVILRKAFPLKGRNIGFLLNHTGLWLILFAALIGSGDLKRLIVNLYEDEDYINMAADMQFKQYKFPFSLKLIDFNIEEYSPKLVIFDNETHQKITGKKKYNGEIKNDLEISMLNWNITVKYFIPGSVPAGNTYVSSEREGSSPAALIYAVNNNTKDSVSGWITCGSYKITPQFLQLDERCSLAMTIPEPRKYNSLIDVYYGNEIHDTISLVVNKPVNIKGWILYQVGYNNRMGKWSDLSIIELVRDPWLPVVYAGIFILLAGAIYLFWRGKEIKD